MTRPPWKDEPGEVGGVPAMVSREERRYLHWLGRTQWRDAGHVLEIGPWLGGSTVCLASGMRAGRARPLHALHAVDNFRWREFMARYTNLPLAPGDSFRAYFEKNVEPFGSLVRVHTAVLPDETIESDALADLTRAKASESDPPFEWDAREPIEVLFIDGAKSWRGMRHLLATVQGALRPGESLLVAQDYKHWGAYWVPLFLREFAGSLELVHDVRRGSTITFRLREELAGERIRALPDHSGALDLGASRAALDGAARELDELGDDLGGAQVRLGVAMLALHRGDRELAAATYREARAHWPAGADDHALRQAHERLARSGVEGLEPPAGVSRLARLRRRLFRRA